MVDFIFSSITQILLHSYYVLITEKTEIKEEL